MTQQKKIDPAFRARVALEALREGANVPDIARRYGVHPNRVYLWKKHLLDNAARAFVTSPAVVTDDASRREIDDLYAKIGRLTVERDFLAKRSGR